MRRSPSGPTCLGPGWERTSDLLPEYNNHGDVLNRHWHRLSEERPGFQFYLVGEGDEVLARAHSLPLRWDETIADLPTGIDRAIARGLDEGDANVLTTGSGSEEAGAAGERDGPKGRTTDARLHEGALT